METEIIIRGYPTKTRFADWVKANELPESELPKLSEEQKRRASFLRVREKAYAAAMKTGELTRDYAFERLIDVAGAIARNVKKQDPEADLKSVVWDFDSQHFEFLILRKSQNQVSECLHFMDPTLVDEVVLGCQGAERKLIAAAQRELTDLAA
jgi:hypothetical protein